MTDHERAHTRLNDEERTQENKPTPSHLTKQDAPPVHFEAIANEKILYEKCVTKKESIKFDNSTRVIQKCFKSVKETAILKSTST